MRENRKTCKTDRWFLTNARLPFDKRSFGLRQTLVWVLTNARLCLVFPSFVRGQTKALFSSSEVAEHLFLSREFLDAFLGVFRCCRGALLLPSMASLRWLYETPAMGIRTPFDGFTTSPWWKSASNWWESKFSSMEIGGAEKVFCFFILYYLWLALYLQVEVIKITYGEQTRFEETYQLFLIGTLCRMYCCVAV